MNGQEELDRLNYFQALVKQLPTKDDTYYAAYHAIDQLVGKLEAMEIDVVLNPQTNVWERM